MDKKVIDFYDKESAYYSDKRYAPIIQSYTQYVFRTRLNIFLSYLEKIEKDLPKEASIFEIGCADGVVFKAVEQKFPGRFLKLVGMDISPKMIEEAIKKNDNTRATFFIRDQAPLEKFDVVVELGVHPFDVEGESKYVSEHLKTGGYFFYDSAGSNSIYRHLKLKDAVYAEDYKPYKVYEDILRKFFIIKHTEAYGLFIPKIWKHPSIARFIQPKVDRLFRCISSNLFHEKLYVLIKDREVSF
jgi:SAM-dependent methyltransferase